jgi:hypothetical protein
MNQQWKSHSRRARRSTTAAFPRRAPRSVYIHTQYPCLIVPRSLRVNYVPRLMTSPQARARASPARDCGRCFSKNNPSLATGRSLGRTSKVSRFAPALCVTIHTRERETLARERIRAPPEAGDPVVVDGMSSSHPPPCVAGDAPPVALHDRSAPAHGVVGFPDAAQRPSGALLAANGLCLRCKRNE